MLCEGHLRAVDRTHWSLMAVTFDLCDLTPILFFKLYLLHYFSSNKVNLPTGRLTGVKRILYMMMTTRWGHFYPDNNRTYHKIEQYILTEVEVNSQTFPSLPPPPSNVYFWTSFYTHCLVSHTTTVKIHIQAADRQHWDSSSSVVTVLSLWFSSLISWQSQPDIISLLGFVWVVNLLLWCKSARSWRPADSEEPHERTSTSTAESLTIVVFLQDLATAAADLDLEAAACSSGHSWPREQWSISLGWKNKH